MKFQSSSCMTWVVVRLLLIVLFAVAPRSLFASTWTYLGMRGAELSLSTDVFIDWVSVEDLGQDQFLAKTLNVFPNTVAGIDFFDLGIGHVYDMRYPHRSYVLEAVYDCSQRMTAVIRTTYFSGERPTQGHVVYDAIESDVAFKGPYLGIPSETLVLDAICDPKRLNWIELLSSFASAPQKNL